MKVITFNFYFFVCRVNSPEANVNIITTIQTGTHKQRQKGKATPATGRGGP
jgi:hypothetical protein